jgi:hypothetical protein
MNNHFHLIVCAVITGLCDNFAVRHPSMSENVDRYSQKKGKIREVEQEIDLITQFDECMPMALA